MSIVGIPGGGLKTVGQIIATNEVTFRPGQNGLAIALELLSTHTAGAPVIDNSGKYIGFINELDVLKVLDEGKELRNLVAEDMMRVGPIEERGVLNLPVEEDGRVAYSVSRHDLLREWVALGLEMGLGGWRGI